MNKEQMLKRLAMNIVNQLFDLADVPVEKRQAVNDEADAFVLRLLQQCGVSGALPNNCIAPLGGMFGCDFPDDSCEKCRVSNDR